MTGPDRSDGFYLGRAYDLEEKAVRDTPVYYDPRDLTTHGVVVGMTGSGKTGLSVTLLEEAALQGIPCVVIDLKGDLSNLLLNFPDLAAEDLAPWVDADEARRRNTTVEELAAERAGAWRSAWSEWGLGPQRVRQLREAADWRVYTPGSEAGLPVSVVQNFAAPAGGLDRETLNERVEATATALLGLTQIAADPVQSREHILISNLLLHAWTQGRDLDLPHLINEITAPPVRVIGAFDIDMFYPEEERLRLALTLNNLLASPSFSTWLSGEPLSLASMLYGPDGRPRQLIFYLAHLDDSQRMFFLTLLLSEVLSWTRAQAGTGSLRALLYFDELYGYLPPHPANPPTKRPLLTLLKQARAFGLGLLLATQNPVDLDYKALSNAGTWFVGKLQTDRDKARLLEGLEGVSAESGTLADAAYLDRAISALGNRVFLLHNVHAPAPALFHTRAALSYLYGPMTRDHVARVMAPHRGVVAPAARRACPECRAAAPPEARFCMFCGTALAAPQPAPAEPAPEAAPEPGLPAADTTPVPPVLPPGLPQFFLPESAAAAERAGVPRLYRPRLLAFAEVLFNDRRHKLDHRHVYRLLALPPDAVNREPWLNAEEIPEAVTASHAGPDGLWAVVPESINDGKKLRKLEQELAYFLSKNAALTIYHNRYLGLLSKPGEGRDEFVTRCLAAAAEAVVAELAEKPAAPAAGDAPPARAPRAKSAARVEQKWRQRAEAVREVRLAARKADVRVTHFGLAWVPFLVEEGEPTPAYEAAALPPDFWRTATATA